MTAPTTTLSERDDFYAFLKRLHGHRCPMSILGARLGLAARERVGRHGEDGDVAAVYYHRTCAIDGIQAALGTTSGNTNIEVRPEGIHRLEAVNKTKRMYVTVSLTEEALSRGREYGELRRSGGDKARMEEILKGLEAAPESELIMVEAAS
jgi:formylmethanofuran dehydrogenase subunit E